MDGDRVARNRLIGPNAILPDRTPALTRRPQRPVAAGRAPAPLADIAIVTVYLDRPTGAVTVDREFANPLEAWAMLAHAADDLDAQLHPELDE